MTSLLISADDIKKELPGYSPDRAEEFHLESAKLADKRFDEYLKSSSCKEVVLMSGGPASGKTEFVTEYLMDQDVLIFDGILPTIEGAKIKLERIRKSKKQVKIYAVWPYDLRQAYTAFLSRDRRYSDKHFYTKHASARKTLLWIASSYPDIEIKLFKSAYLNKELGFTEVAFGFTSECIAFLSENQYNEDQIIDLVKA
ncbi:MAG: hypothetical protein A3C02_04305 [Candidatus Andersenbacteria bacterium RIFCSPHIGHO2_02_FULL_45_11]|uniref:UDP-N-acetylglucosamine kinase n=1 Tax=Candidatus Andersenbacteria bacterium RIFCSPHIGHO2_12_FULL_45_11 TaxID=1797281 RepID=A0A1G1X0A8_9BACT|nr:MAG: hypothetical protein A3C02_04305 [Candidatus Andersenbacteria bacterium RIFCSPHIGHO2_02_FULL_45_11]OGY33439.1 MAG: hypothetical protein A3D99_04835 [Candidatus Andersenbacteria bacterium RIFCSPHIGHO2_12_FULL_45_11]